VKLKKQRAFKKLNEQKFNTNAFEKVHISSGVPGQARDDSERACLFTTTVWIAISINSNKGFEKVA
jgi:hypothetical protein